jgi:hypothetical protein
VYLLGNKRLIRSKTRTENEQGSEKEGEQRGTYTRRRIDNRVR